jgi:hypothetical protein
MSMCCTRVESRDKKLKLLVRKCNVKRYSLFRVGVLDDEYEENVKVKIMFFTHPKILLRGTFIEFVSVEVGQSHYNFFFQAK